MNSWSAVIPLKGRPELVKDALLSVISQTLPPREIVVAIDSTGREREADAVALHEFRKQNPHKLKEIHLKTVYSCGQGPAAARNLGAAQCSAEWIAFLDSDDLWMPEKCALQTDYLARRPFLHLCHTGEVWMKNGRRLTTPARLSPVYGRCLKDAFTACLISPSSAMIRRTVFEELGGFDPAYPVCEDYEFWIRFLSRYPAGFVPEALTVKRSGDWPQLTSQHHSLDLYRAAALLKNIRIQNWPQEIREKALNEAKKKLAIVRSGLQKRGHYCTAAGSQIRALEHELIQFGNA